jgi:diacylglycerol kinase (ATP)
VPTGEKHAAGVRPRRTRLAKRGGRRLFHWVGLGRGLVHPPARTIAGVVLAAGLGIAAGVTAQWVFAATGLRRGDAPPEDNGVPRRAVLLTSPNAGSSRGLALARAAMLKADFDILEEIPVQAHHRLVVWLSHPGAQRPLVVAAGGDGTVGTAADYLADTETVLGILPLGTSNDFARSLGLPTDPVRAARLLVTGKISTIDAGRVIVPGQPPRHFVHAATVGLNVSFAKLATQASLRRRFGRLTYAVAAAQALRAYESFDCELQYDGHHQRLRLLHLSVINAPVFGGFLGLRVRAANLDDRILAVEHLSRRRLLLAALQPVLGLRRPIRGMHTLRVRTLHVHTNQPLDITLDGEVDGTLPADFEVAAEALRVLTPTDFDDIHD